MRLVATGIPTTRLRCTSSSLSSSRRHVDDILKRSSTRDITDAAGGGKVHEKRPLLHSLSTLRCHQRCESVANSSSPSSVTDGVAASSLPQVYYNMRRFGRSSNISSSSTGAMKAAAAAAAGLFPHQSSPFVFSRRSTSLHGLSFSTTFFSSPPDPSLHFFVASSVVASLSRPVAGTPFPTTTTTSDVVSAAVSATAAASAAVAIADPPAYCSRSLFKATYSSAFVRSTSADTCHHSDDSITAAATCPALSIRAVAGIPVTDAAASRHGVSHRRGLVASFCTLTRVTPISRPYCSSLPFLSAFISLSQMREDSRAAMFHSVRRPVSTPQVSEKTQVLSLKSYCSDSSSFRRNSIGLFAPSSYGIVFFPTKKDATITTSPGHYHMREVSCAGCPYNRSYTSFSPLRSSSSSTSTTTSTTPITIITRRRQGFLLPAASAGRAAYSSADDASSFDIFQRLKDPPDKQRDDGAEGTAGRKKRKPSDRVLRLVDEVMNLTLIEAADLCDLCQEKLAERSGGPTFNAAAAAGRTPFPHPAAMFAGMAMQGAMPTAFPAMGAGAPAQAAMPGSAAGQQPGAAQTGAEASKAAEKPEKKDEAKATLSIKLMGYDAAKKVAVVKEVRTITALGLKESKDLVEQAPKILKKGVPAADAEALKKKLEAAGAQVALE